MNNFTNSNSCQNLKSNIALDQYAQVSCLLPDSQVISSFGPLRKNKENEIYFDLSKAIAFDPFHPLAGQQNLDKFYKAYELCGRKKAIEDLINDLIASDNNFSYRDRCLTLNNLKIDEKVLLKKGIKADYSEPTKIHLYLPLSVKDKHIRDIFKIIKSLCTE